MQINLSIRFQMLIPVTRHKSYTLQGYSCYVIHWYRLKKGIKKVWILCWFFKNAHSSIAIIRFWWKKDNFSLVLLCGIFVGLKWNWNMLIWHMNGVTKILCWEDAFTSLFEQHYSFFDIFTPKNTSSHFLLAEDLHFCHFLSIILNTY